MQCSACGSESPVDDLFCENCGVRLDGAVVASVLRCACGSETDADGYCVRCGRLVRDSAADHVEQVLTPAFAAISDRGRKHAANEDRFGIAQTGDVATLVVCDGVSSSRRPELAAQAVRDAVLAALTQAATAAGDAGDASDAERLMRAAIEAAAASLRGDAGMQAEDNPPSTTMVAALLAGKRLTVGWVGDSRAYWVDEQGAHQLTRDHSWAVEMVAAHQLSSEEAEHASEAHAITRWLGADAGDHAAADVVSRTVDGEGMLLLCTDGLWNYAASEDVMTSTVRAAVEASGDAIQTARWLVEFANSAGGHDNVTVAILKCNAGDEFPGEQTHGH